MMDPRPSNPYRAAVADLTWQLQNLQATTRSFIRSLEIRLVLRHPLHWAGRSLVAGARRLFGRSGV